MTWAAVGSEIFSTSSSFSLTPGGTGHLILIEVANFSNTTVWATSLSSSNVTWSQVGSKSVGSSYTAALFAGKVTAASAATVTVAWSGGTPGSMQATGQEFSSSLGAWSLDGSQANLSSGGTNAWPSLTPSASGGLYFGWAQDSGTAVAGATSGYSYVVDAHGNGLAYNLNCASGVSTHPVWGDSGQQFGIMVMMKESAAVAGATLLLSALP